MTVRAWWPVVALLAVAPAGCGPSDAGGADRVAGCTVPDDEDALLDAYTEDPVVAVQPEGAPRSTDLARSTGCRQLNKEDVSQTAIVLTWRPRRDYDGPTLRRAFDPVASGAGWRYMVDPDATPDQAGETTLTYCRQVRGVTSRLLVRAQPAQRMDVRPSTADRPPSPVWAVVHPPLIYLTIYADPACPKP